jgi:predicted DNA-binding transcriptional regulator AlpA
MTLRQIQAEKIGRSRSWILTEIAARRFPRPLDLGGNRPNLWAEEDVDRFLAEFIASPKNREVPRDGAAKRIPVVDLNTRRKLNELMPKYLAEARRRGLAIDVEFAHIVANYSANRETVKR